MKEVDTQTACKIKIDKGIDGRNDRIYIVTLYSNDKLLSWNLKEKLNEFSKDERNKKEKNTRKKEC